MDYTSLSNKIYYHHPFAFSRWGDGEWNAISGKKGSNCDGHEYFPSLGKALVNILATKPDYYLGLQPLARRNQFKTIDATLKERGVSPDWINSDIIHNESIKNGLKSLFARLRKRNVIIIGNAHMIKIKKHLPHFELVIVPQKNAWLSYDHLKKILKVRAKMANDTVFLFAAGMMSNVLIDDCYHENRGNTYIDVGSALDPYVGIKSRTYHHKL